MLMISALASYLPLVKKGGGSGWFIFDYILALLLHSTGLNHFLRGRALSSPHFDHAPSQSTPLSTLFSSIDLQQSQ